MTTRGRRMPERGQRPVFGVHRLPEEEATTAPGWPDLDTVELLREVAYLRSIGLPEADIAPLLAGTGRDAADDDDEGDDA